MEGALHGRLHHREGRAAQETPSARDVRAAGTFAIDAQPDVGEAIVVIGGVERNAHYLAVYLPQSDESRISDEPGLASTARNVSVAWKWADIPAATPIRDS